MERLVPHYNISEFDFSLIKISIINFCFKGGWGGGGWFRPIILETLVLRY